MENFYEQLDVLPGNLAGHLKITVIALMAGIAISLPLAVLATRRRKLRYPTLTTASVIQTIPSMALLALMFPVLTGLSYLTVDLFGARISALGFWPTIIVLTLYSTLPILRNTVTGILAVDPAMTEAARGVGMTPRQVLFKVELPLAAPVIIAGIRTATVWVVGIATLASPIGQKCLGDYIFSGLYTKNWLAVLFGCVSAAVLAIVLDLLIGGLERSAGQRRRVLGALCGGMLAAVVVCGILAPNLVGWLRAGRAARVATTQPGQAGPAQAGRTLRIGAKNFTEQYILAALIGDVLGEAGYQTETVKNLGSAIIFDALAADEIDLYVDYSGTIWANYMKRTETAAGWRVLAEVAGWSAREHGIRCLGPLGFENAYAMAMRRDRAKQLGIRTVADLAPHTPKMKVGGSHEFFDRPEWRAIRDTYGLNFAEQMKYGPTFMYDAVDTGEVDVISAFSSDGRIAAYNLVVLRDPRRALPPYDAVLLLAPRVAGQADLARALRPLIRAINLGQMQQANNRVDREQDKRTPAEAARWLRGQMGR